MDNDSNTLGDRSARQMVAHIRYLPLEDEESLLGTETRAAQDYAAYALHGYLPVEDQGDSTEAAWAIRNDRMRAARDLWLAVQSERKRRRAAILEADRLRAQVSDACRRAGDAEVTQ